MTTDTTKDSETLDLVDQAVSGLITREELTTKLEELHDCKIMSNDEAIAGQAALDKMREEKKSGSLMPAVKAAINPIGK